MATLTSILVSSSGVSSILSPSSATNAFNTFTQEQNQTASTSGNNASASTNETAEAASTFNEMLNPRQIEYSIHLGFNDLHMEAIRHIDPNATKSANQSEQDIFNFIVHHHCKLYDDMTVACLLFPNRNE
jgi:hypothetical protein